jgi:hypothetical protein
VWQVENPHTASPLRPWLIPNQGRLLLLTTILTGWQTSAGLNLDDIDGLL